MTFSVYKVKTSHELDANLLQDFDSDSVPECTQLIFLPCLFKTFPSISVLQSLHLTQAWESQSG